MNAGGSWDLPQMIERGGDLGDPNQGKHASKRDKKWQEQRSTFSRITEKTFVIPEFQRIISPLANKFQICFLESQDSSLQKLSIDSKFC